MTPRIVRVAALTALLLCADACKSQTILGKHPADKVLPGFWAQNGNANTTISQLGTYGTVPWYLPQATVGSLTLGGQTRTTWPATGLTVLPAGAPATNLNIRLDPQAGGQPGLFINYKNGNNALDRADQGSFSLGSASGHQLVYYNGGSIGADQFTLQRDGNRPFLVSGPGGTVLYDELGNPQLGITQTKVTVGLPLGYELSVVNQRVNYTLLPTDSGSYLNNNGASGSVTYTLPPTSPGLHFSLVVIAAQTVGFKAAAGDVIRYQANPGMLVFSSTPWYTLHLVSPAFGVWVVDSTTGGVWTLQ